MKQYLLKEYGAWSVMIISYLTGIFVSLKTSPQVDMAWTNGAVTLIALALFINAKHSFMKWMHKHSRHHLMVSISQVITASVILIVIFGANILKLLPYLAIPLIYFALLKLAGEHSIITEACGFAVLTLSALIAGFSITGYIDNKLYLSVAVFFIAGVLKVRVQTRKGLPERVYMAIYIFLAVFIYSLIKTPLIVLSPLIDNLILSITLYNVRLKTTGWIEVLKGIMFLLLITKTQGIYGP